MGLLKKMLSSQQPVQTVDPQNAVSMPNELKKIDERVTVYDRDRDGPIPHEPDGVPFLCQTCNSEFHWRDNFKHMHCWSCEPPPSKGAVESIWQAAQFAVGRSWVECEFPRKEIKDEGF